MTDSKSQFNAAANDDAPPSPEERLSNAVRNGDVQSIRKILDAYPNLSSDRPVIRDHMTVLSFAIMWGDLDLARYMLERGANANWRKSPNHHTPLMEALRVKKAKAFVGLLLEYHADVTATDSSGNNVLHHALHFRAAPAVIRKLVKAKCDPFLPNKQGRTAFHMGACGGHVEGLKTLMDLTGDKFVTNPLTGLTPVRDLQTIDEAALSGNGLEKKAEMTQFLTAHQMRKILAATHSATQQPLPALRKIGRKP